MATYKVVDAEQLNADMSSVADSIRTKGGTTDALAWPDGYKTAIDSIPAGGAPSLQSKSVTYTSNGTNTITPDEGYDGLSSVDVTVDVASGGGGSSEYEECIVQFKGTIYSGGSLVYVILKNGTPQIANQVISSTITLNNFASLSVLKNCLFVVNNGNETFSVEGNVSYLHNTKLGYVPFFATGDCKINFS